MGPHPNERNVMPKPKSRLKVTLVCDRMFGKRTRDWLVTRFPEMKGKTLVFHSDKAVEMVGAAGMLEWLMVNDYL